MLRRPSPCSTGCRKEATMLFRQAHDSAQAPCLVLSAALAMTGTSVAPTITSLYPSCVPALDKSSRPQPAMPSTLLDVNGSADTPTAKASTLGSGRKELLRCVHGLQADGRAALQDPQAGEADDDEKAAMSCMGFQTKDRVKLAMPVTRDTQLLSQLSLPQHRTLPWAGDEADSDTEADSDKDWGAFAAAACSRRCAQEFSREVFKRAAARGAGGGVGAASDDELCSRRRLLDLGGGPQLPRGHAGLDAALQEAQPLAVTSRCAAARAATAPAAPREEFLPEELALRAGQFSY